MSVTQVAVAIGSAAALSKVGISNGHCISSFHMIFVHMKIPGSCEKSSYDRKIRIVR